MPETSLDTNKPLTELRYYRLDGVVYQLDEIQTWTYEENCLFRAENGDFDFHLPRAVVVSFVKGKALQELTDDEVEAFKRAQRFQDEEERLQRLTLVLCEEVYDPFGPEAA